MSTACCEEKKIAGERTFFCGMHCQAEHLAAQQMTSVAAWRSLPQGREALRAILTQVQIPQNKQADLLLQGPVKEAPVCLLTLACPCPGKQTAQPDSFPPPAILSSLLGFARKNPSDPMEIREPMVVGIQIQIPTPLSHRTLIFPGGAEDEQYLRIHLA